MNSSRHRSSQPPDDGMGFMRDLFEIVEGATLERHWAVNDELLIRLLSEKFMPHVRQLILELLRHPVRHLIPENELMALADDYQFLLTTTDKQAGSSDTLVVLLAEERFPELMKNQKTRDKLVRYLTFILSERSG